MISKNAVMRHAVILITVIISANMCDRRGDTLQPHVLTMSAPENASLSFDLHEGVACPD